MGATGIEWTKGPNGEPGFTFNPWIGCTKVSGACDHCYAEAASKKLDVVWGPHGDRRGITDGTWAAPIAWNRAAGRAGARYRVFVASMADVLDNHKSIDPAWRARLYALIEQTPNLDWLMLTKRPENAKKFLPYTWFTKGGWPTNVWFGITGEDQEHFDHRWLHACTIPAPVLFVSVEPMLGRLNIRWTLNPMEVAARFLESGRFSPGLETIRRPGWFIGGGESGTLINCRDTPDEWFVELRAQCHVSGIAYFQKQMAQVRWRARYKKFDQFPALLQIREHPTPRLAA